MIDFFILFLSENSSYLGKEIGKDAQIHPTVKIAFPWNLDVGDGAAEGGRAILFSLGQSELARA